MIRSELEKMYNFIRKTLVAVCLIGGIFTAGLAEAVKIETAQIRITNSDNYGSEEDVSLHAVGRIIAKDIITSSSNGLSNSKITINGSTQLVRNSPNFQFLVLSDLTITEGLLNAFNSNIGVLTLSTNYLKNIQNCSILDLNADETDTGMFLAPDGNGKVIWQEMPSFQSSYINAYTPVKLLSNGNVNWIGISTNAHFYIELTNSESYITFDPNITSPNVSASIVIEIRPISSMNLTVTANGGNVIGYPERVYLDFDMTTQVIFTKPYGETTWIANEM